MAAGSNLYKTYRDLPINIIGLKMYLIIVEEEDFLNYFFILTLRTYPGKSFIVVWEESQEMLIIARKQWLINKHKNIARKFTGF